MLSVGDLAPDFLLTAQDKSIFNTEDYKKHRLLIVFYPAAFTGVCTEETCSVRDDLSSYEELDAQVLGISVDSPFAQEAMALKEGLNFPLLSDFNKDVSKDYGVLYEDFIGFKGVSKRSAFVISKDGEILFAWSSEDPKQLPDFEAIKGVL